MLSVILVLRFVKLVQSFAGLLQVLHFDFLQGSFLLEKLGQGYGSCLEFAALFTLNIHFFGEVLQFDIDLAACE